MQVIYLYLIVAFVIAGTVGLLLYKTPLWDLVDVVYYPLAAFGVALLFVSNTTQRALVQVDEQLQQNRLALQTLQNARPGIDKTPGPELVEISFSLISGIAKLADVCSQVPRMDPTCSVAQKMKPAIDAFSAVASGRYQSQELRLAAACRAGSDLLAKLRTNERMSSLIGDELAAQFSDARKRGQHLLDIGAPEREGQEFERRAMARLEWLRKAINDNSDSMNFVFSMNQEEVKFGKTIIHALFPCLVVPQASLDRLADWTVTRQTQETALARLEEERKRVQSTPSTSLIILWIHLNLWPLILIAALSLKFSKGVASIRKHVADAKVRPASSRASHDASRPDTSDGEDEPATKPLTEQVAPSSCAKRMDPTDSTTKSDA